MYEMCDLLPTFYSWCSCFGYWRNKNPTTSHIPVQQGDMQKFFFSVSSSAISFHCPIITTSVPLGEYLAWSPPHPLKAEQTRLTGPPLKRTMSPRQCIGSLHSLPSLGELSSQSASWGNRAALTSRPCTDKICVQLLSKTAKAHVQARSSPPKMQLPEAHSHIEFPGDWWCDCQSKNFPAMGYPKVSYPNNHQVFFTNTSESTCLAL